MATKKTNKPHGNRKDISGLKFGRWTVIRCLGPRNNKLLWECRCDCGNTGSVIGSNLVRGLSVSCGCYRVECNVTHGKARTPEYAVWDAARRRCFKPSDMHYPTYGGRGITMCPEWRNSFQAFYEYMGPRPKGHSLDRIDNNGNYEPGNVRWATTQVQIRNRRITIRVTHQGETLSLAEWSEKTGIAYGTLVARYFSPNKPPLFEPVKNSRKQK